MPQAWVAAECATIRAPCQRASIVRRQCRDADDGGRRQLYDAEQVSSKHAKYLNGSRSDQHGPTTGVTGAWLT